MHLGNSIICPAVGIPMLALMGTAAFWAFKKARQDFKKDRVLPTISLTALVFAMQMINFTIPLTGSSGHFIGGLLLAALLGPYVGFLAICSILLVQALFFADGGLLALGCNIFNMGFVACFAAYPLIFKPLKGNNRAFLSAFLASLAALQLGSLSAVTEAAISNPTTADISLFTGLMQSIHLVIGVFEGILSAVILKFAYKTGVSKKFSCAIACIAAILAGFISNYASTKPDGLEWSLLKMPETFAAQAQGAAYQISELIQAKTSVLLAVSPIVANISGLIILCVFMLVLSKALMAKKQTA